MSRWRSCCGSRRAPCAGPASCVGSGATWPATAPRRCRAVPRPSSGTRTLASPMSSTTCPRDLQRAVEAARRRKRRGRARNGLLCLCDDEEIGGVITLVNPATGETLPLPPLPCAGRFIGLHHQNMWHSAYSFACHPTSGRYKVVHVPCIFGHVCEFVGNSACVFSRSAKCRGGRCPWSATSTAVRAAT